MTAESWLDENDAVGQIAVSHALGVLRGTPSGVRVLGADGFTALNHPTLDFIADFSRSPMTLEASVAAAIDTLASWPGDLLVEQVVSDEERRSAVLHSSKSLHRRAATGIMRSA